MSIVSAQQEKAAINQASPSVAQAVEFAKVRYDLAYGPKARRATLAQQEFNKVILGINTPHGHTIPELLAEGASPYAPIRDGKNAFRILAEFPRMGTRAEVKTRIILAAISGSAAYQASLSIAQAVEAAKINYDWVHAPKARRATLAQQEFNKVILGINTPHGHTIPELLAEGASPHAPISDGKNAFRILAESPRMGTRTEARTRHILRAIAGLSIA